MKTSLWGLCAVCVASLLLTACGGNDDGYGSVAVSDSTRRVAISTGALTQSVANDEARDECDASDCRVVLQFEQCGAVWCLQDALQCVQPVCRADAVGSSQQMQIVVTEDGFSGIT
mgnify:CR=1 FL=1